MATRPATGDLGRLQPPDDEVGAPDDDLDGGGSLAPAVTRAAAILDVLASHPTDPAGPSELARRLGLPKSSIANILNAMADAGLLRRVGSGYGLGRKMAELGGAYLASVDLVQEFYDACRELPAASDETIRWPCSTAWR